MAYERYNMKKTRRKKNAPFLERPTTPQLKEVLLDMFYNILVICESHQLDKIKLTISNDNIKNFFTHNYLNEESNEKILKFAWSNDYEKLDFNNNLDDNKIIFYYNSNIAKSLLVHLRNAFAHNRIIKEGNQLILEDYSSRTSSTTMIGKVEIGCLVEFLNIIQDFISYETKNLH